MDAWSPWAKESPSTEACFDCGKEVPYGQSYCSSCRDRRREEYWREQ